jgi:hypothetical protein
MLVMPALLQAMSSLPGAQPAVRFPIRPSD